MGINAAGISGADRQIVLFKLVNALADQLRGVFAPYYKTLAELMVGHLGGSKATVSGVAKKKRRMTEALSEYDGPDAPFLRYQARFSYQGENLESWKTTKDQASLRQHKCIFPTQVGKLLQQLRNASSEMLSLQEM